MARSIAIVLLHAVLLAGAPPAAPTEAAYPLLVQAYDALHRHDYETAIRSFRQALQLTPDRAETHTDLAYTLLDVGENRAARDEFAAAMKLTPHDERLALEYAFLCYETGEPRQARRVFDRLRQTGVPETRREAEAAFARIDRPLAEGIERWRKAVAADPANFSARLELARLADRRDEWELAAENYEKAWRLRPERRGLLLDLGRVWREMGRRERAQAALLAASRGAEPRTGERARALLPRRYPYVSEFEQALELDPGNAPLRRELAFLLLEMKRPGDAERHLARLIEIAPDDLLAVTQLGLLRLKRKDYNGAMPLLEKILASGDEELANRVRRALGENRDANSAVRTPAGTPGAKAMARRSLDAGYVKDAVKYLQRAHQADPTDFEVLLDLGRAKNILQQDEEARRWFNLARRSPDPKIATEAEQAYHNLRPSQSRFRFSFWMMPLYSSRWRDMFGYAQIKTEVRFKRLPIRPYVSVRFDGDARRTIGTVAPQYLSESSFVFGVGLRTVSWNGLMAWVEAGSDISYLDHRDRPGRMAPDYRGGVSFSKGFGNPLGGEAPGVFLATYENGVYMSRFNQTVLGYTQNRLGYTLPAAGGFESQLYWNGNLTVDSKRQNWANYAEFGPGIRFRWKLLPRSMSLSIDLLRGFYLLPNSPRGPSYNDLRVSIWYAFSK